MSNRGARIEQILQIVDSYPVDRYPEPLRKAIRADLAALKKQMAIEADIVLARESSEMIGSIQALLATLRIDIDALLELIE